MQIIQNDSVFSFTVSDQGTLSFDLKECMARSRSAGNDVNYGIGLGIIIRDLAPQLGIELTVDTTRGFRYTGTYTKGTFIVQS